MRSTFILSLVFLCANVCEAQSDNFADGDFTNNPIWTPDNSSNWTVVSNQLRSNSSAANSGFYISTPSTRVGNTQWEFFVNLQFNTSGANYVDVYLTSQLADLSSPANSGYFVRIGGTPDEVSLYKVSAGVSTIIINGADGTTNKSNNILRVKVTRDASSNWTLERDASVTGNNYISEGSVSDSTFTTSQFLGIRIQQSTAGFFNRHYFDDLYVGDIITDTTPPSLLSLNVISSTQLELVFDEKLESTSSQNTANYFSDHGLGNPVSATLQADAKTVLLLFSYSFTDAVSNNLLVNGIKDLAGNLMNTASKNFAFLAPVSAKRKDVIITEFFPDPSPQLSLPDEEFVEIYNRSEKSFDLKGWKLSDGSSESVFSSRIIMPQQYLILTASSTVAKFSAYDNVLGVSNFPTLNNTEDRLTLKSPEGVLIDSIHYDLSWYRDEDKQQGGWSLELIDPNNLCGEEDNWTSSEDERGGTPGQKNSVFANKPDLTGPHLEKVVVQAPGQLLLAFNEKLDEHVSWGVFLITPETEVSEVSFTDQALRTIQLNLGQSLQTQKLYTLRVDNVYDCNGNVIEALFSELQFAVPEKADSLDVLVNEILFNPRPTGFDFVEVYNNSPRFINLKGWQISNLEERKLKNPKLISDNDLILAPRSYLVFTPDQASLKTNYSSSVEKTIIAMTLPSMPDDEGSVALTDERGQVIDYFQYSEKFHSGLIKDPEGVSLERISFSYASNDDQNWKSANSASGFATPGYMNSGSRPEAVVSAGKVNVAPQLFTPGAGSDDFTKINYRFDQSGLVANIKIVDQQGRFIRQLANNETLNYEGFFKWEGDRDDGSRARMGYYVVWFEVFDLSGFVKTYRERVMIAGN